MNNWPCDIFLSKRKNGKNNIQRFNKMTTTTRDQNPAHLPRGTNTVLNAQTLWSYFNTSTNRSPQKVKALYIFCEWHCLVPNIQTIYKKQYTMNSPNSHHRFCLDHVVSWLIITTSLLCRSDNHIREPKWEAERRDGARTGEQYLQNQISREKLPSFLLRLPQSAFHPNPYFSPDVLLRYPKKGI